MRPALKLHRLCLSPFHLIAGAGTMTTLISLRAEYAALNISIAVFLNVIIVYVVLRLTKKIENILGIGGIAILKKVFGIILLAIAVKLFADNARALFTM
jgi:multiple antibiotic resistance protein